MNYNIDLIISDYNLRRTLFPTDFSTLPHEISECFEFYIDGLISARKSPNTISSYYFDIKVFLLFISQRYEHIKSLDELNVISIRKYFTYLETEKKNSYSSIARKKTVLRNFLDYLIEQNVVSFSKYPIPTESVIKSKISKKSKLPTYLVKEEIKDFIKVLEESKECKHIKIRNLAIFTLLINSGLRISELISLDMSDIENALHNNIMYIKGKGEKTRVVPINKNELESGSLNYLVDYYNLRLADDNIDKAFFLSRNNKRITPRGIQMMIRKYSLLSNPAKSITPHKLRHTYATELIRSDVNIRQVQALLGHSSISTTQIYTHVSVEDLKKDIQNLVYS